MFITFLVLFPYKTIDLLTPLNIISDKWFVILQVSSFWYLAAYVILSSYLAYKEKKV